MCKRTDADYGSTVFLCLQSRVYGGRIDPVCVDQDQQILLPDAIIVHHNSAISGQTLHLHGFQCAVRQHGVLIQYGADMHQAAGAEKDFHGSQIGMSSGPPDINKPVLFNLFGNGSCRRQNMILFLLMDFPDDSQNLLVIHIHHISFCHFNHLTF